MSKHIQLNLISLLFLGLLSCGESTENKQQEVEKVIPPIVDTVTTVHEPEPVALEDTIIEINDTITKAYIHASDKNYTIKVMEYNHTDLRYYCWNKPKKTSEEPDLILRDGVLEYQGTQGGLLFTFKKDIYTYVIDNRYMAEEIDGVGITLNVYENEALLVESKLLELEELSDSTYTVQQTEKLKNVLLFCTGAWNELYAEAGIRTNFINSSGIRGRYGMLKNEIGIAILENIIGEEVFRVNPHKEGMNYSSIFFGRYNPKFIARLYMELSELFVDREFVAKTQALYDNQWKNYLRTYYMSYSLAANKDKYYHTYDQDDFMAFSDSIEIEGYDPYEGLTCPGFWARRSMGGTSNDFLKLIKLTLHTFDRDFILGNVIEETENESGCNHVDGC